MYMQEKTLLQYTVALLAEGVDRNLEDLKKELKDLGRPPRGGRG